MGFFLLYVCLNFFSRFLLVLSGWACASCSPCQTFLHILLTEALVLVVDGVSVYVLLDAQLLGLCLHVVLCGCQFWVRLVDADGVLLAVIHERLCLSVLLWPLVLFPGSLPAWCSSCGPNWQPAPSSPIVFIWALLVLHVRQGPLQPHFAPIGDVQGVLWRLSRAPVQLSVVYCLVLAALCYRGACFFAFLLSPGFSDLQGVEGGISGSEIVLDVDLGFCLASSLPSWWAPQPWSWVAAWPPSRRPAWQLEWVLGQRKGLTLNCLKSSGPHLSSFEWSRYKFIIISVSWILDVFRVFWFSQCKLENFMFLGLFWVVSHDFSYFKSSEFNFSDLNSPGFLLCSVQSFDLLWVPLINSETCIVLCFLTICLN